MCEFCFTVQDITLTFYVCEECEIKFYKNKLDK